MSDKLSSDKWDGDYQKFTDSDFLQLAHEINGMAFTQASLYSGEANTLYVSVSGLLSCNFMICVIRDDSDGAVPLYEVKYSGVELSGLDERSLLDVVMILRRASGLSSYDDNRTDDKFEIYRLLSDGGKYSVCEIIKKCPNLNSTLSVDDVYTVIAEMNEERLFFPREIEIDFPDGLGKWHHESYDFFLEKE